MFCDWKPVCEGVTMSLNIKWFSPETQRALPKGCQWPISVTDFEAGKRECEEIEQMFFFNYLYFIYNTV